MDRVSGIAHDIVSDIRGFSVLLALCRCHRGFGDAMVALGTKGRAIGIRDMDRAATLLAKVERVKKRCGLRVPWQELPHLDREDLHGAVPLPGSGPG